MSGRLIQFGEVCERLAATSRKLEKRALIAGYLRSLDPRAAARAALYFAGMPFAATEGRQLNVGGALLSRVLAELAKASQPAMRAAYLRRGDLGGAAFDLLSVVPERRSVAPTLTLADIDAAFAAIAAATKPSVKQRLVWGLLVQASLLEAKYLIKIVLGDMRTGVKESLVEEAIAAAYDAKVAAVRRAMTLNGNLSEVSLLAAEGRLDEARMTLFHPLGFMLASPVATSEEALERFSQASSSKEETSTEFATATETEASQPQPPLTGTRQTGTQAQLSQAQIPQAQIPQAQIEDKYDGVRAQIHCGDPNQPGRVALFSRTREDMTVSFPEIVEAFADFPQPVILDGEILAWDASGSERGGRALPFTALQPRLGRKQVAAGMRESAPAVFMAFDLLYAGDQLLLEQSLAERRQALEEMVAREQPRTAVRSRPPSLSGQAALQFGPPEPAQDAFPRLALAPAVGLESVQQLEQAYEDARARGNEGVMLKALASVYQPGRRGMAWLKLKRELATLDVVVTAAEYGHGKRAGALSDYTFAVRDGGALKNVGKAYSGLTDAEIATLTEFFLEHTLEDFGHMRSVEPLVVLEVAFNNVMRSGRHESGFALRFPRIVRIRNDKPPGEIDTLDRVAEIFASQSAPLTAIRGFAAKNRQT